MVKQIIDSIETSRFQQIFLFFVVLYIVSLLFLQYRWDYFSEKNVEINNITTTTEEISQKIEAGLRINSFPKFNFYKNEFIMNAIVWFKFPEGTESLDTISRFNFKNGKISSKSHPVIQKAEDNIIVSYQVRAKFSTPLSYEYFPVSNHKLTIILENKTISPSEAYFDSKDHDLDVLKSINTGNWKLTERYVQSGYTQTQLHQEKGTIDASFPAVVFTIDFKNRNLRHFITLYLPLFLLFFVIFISMLIRLSAISSRISVVVSAMPILALHSLVIESASPPGSHLTKLDQTYLVLILLSLFILFFQSYLGLKLRKFKEKAEEVFSKKLEQLKEMNAIAILMILSILIISLTYTTFT